MENENNNIGAIMVGFMLGIFFMSFIALVVGLINL